MKRGIIISLISIVLFISIISPLWHFVGITKAKLICELKEVLHLKRETTTICFSEPQFKHVKWMSNNEFKWDGKLFDVISIQHKSTHVYVTCEYDGSETESLKLVVSTINNKGKDANTHSILQQNTIQWCLPTSFLICSTNTYTNLSSSQNNYINNTYTSVCIISFSPPPELI